MRISALLLSASLLIGALLFSAGAGSAQAQGQAPDNTAVNQRDRDHQTLTPIDQSTQSQDLQITRDIRRSLIKDDTMSTDARNIKIITANGAVTLRGPVHTAQEKAAVEAKAAQVAGNYRIDDQTEVESK
jgi:hyperosmotically inducible periplasmic protein